MQNYYNVLLLPPMSIWPATSWSECILRITTVQPWCKWLRDMTLIFFFLESLKVIKVQSVSMSQRRWQRQHTVLAAVLPRQRSRGSRCKGNHPSPHRSASLRLWRNTGSWVLKKKLRYKLHLHLKVPTTPQEATAVSFSPVRVIKSNNTTCACASGRQKSGYECLQGCESPGFSTFL